MVKSNLISFGQQKNNLLFKIKDNVKYLNFVICQGICSCRYNYIDENMRNAKITTITKKQVNKKNQTVNRKLLNTPRAIQNINLIGLHYPEHRLKRKNHLTYFIKQLNPSLNDPT